jgi:hypothetical protein
LVAHESQIPDKGDFVRSYMAEEPVVVGRARDGAVMRSGCTRSAIACPSRSSCNWSAQVV